MSKSNNPHDAIAKTFLSDLSVAKDFLSSHLPNTLKARIDFKTLQLEPTSLVDETLKQYTTDILYSVNIDDSLGFIYCLVEAQSTPDKLMPFRFWHYQSLILKHYLKNQAEEKPPLPVIIPLLLYTGKQSPYPYSLELTDCFSDKALAQKMLYEPVHLIDLSQLSDDEIKQHGQVALLEMVQKHIRDRDFIAFAYALISILNKIKITQSLYVSLLEYIITVGDSEKFKDFFKILTEQSTEYRSDTMTIAQRLQNEGAHNEQRNIAFKLFKEGIPFNTIVKVTGLPLSEVSEIEATH